MSKTKAKTSFRNSSDLCNTCDYYDSGIGLCRRRRSTGHGGFSPTTPDAWCGEHSSIEMARMELAQALLHNALASSMMGSGRG